MASQFSLMHSEIPFPWSPPTAMRLSDAERELAYLCSLASLIAHGPEFTMRKWSMLRSFPAPSGQPTGPTESTDVIALRRFKQGDGELDTRVG